VGLNGSLPEPQLWWVHQTGSTVRARQSASCELRLWLVRLDWYSDSHAAICLPKCSGLDSACRNRKLPISDRPIFLISVLIRFPIGFLISGLSIMQAVKFSANTQYIPHRNILLASHKPPLLHIINIHSITVVYCRVLLSYTFIPGTPYPTSSPLPPSLTFSQFLYMSCS
jgi:hypothetical protein